MHRFQNGSSVNGKRWLVGNDVIRQWRKAVRIYSQIINVNNLKGKFSSGVEGTLTSTLNRDFNWKQPSEMILCILFVMFSKFIWVTLIQKQQKKKKETEFWAWASHFIMIWNTYITVRDQCHAIYMLGSCFTISDQCHAIYMLGSCFTISDQCHAIYMLGSCFTIADQCHAIYMLCSCFTISDQCHAIYMLGSCFVSWKENRIFCHFCIFDAENKLRIVKTIYLSF